MKPRVRSLNEDLATALRQVVKSRLKQSGMEEIWRDEHSWRTLVDELVMMLKDKVAFVDRKIYGELVADAEQMKIVRAFVEDYKSRLPKDRREAGERNRNSYARWAAENMTEKKEI